MAETNENDQRTKRAPAHEQVERESPLREPSRADARGYYLRHGKDAIQALLKQFGVTDIFDIPMDRLEEFKAACKK